MVNKQVRNPATLNTMSLTHVGDSGRIPHAYAKIASGVKHTSSTIPVLYVGCTIIRWTIGLCPLLLLFMLSHFLFLDCQRATRRPTLIAMHPGLVLAPGRFIHALEQVMRPLVTTKQRP
jgi:hypothetical protein